MSDILTKDDSDRLAKLIATIKNEVAMNRDEILWICELVNRLQEADVSLAQELGFAHAEITVLRRSLERHQEVLREVVNDRHRAKALWWKEKAQSVLEEGREAA